MMWRTRTLRLSAANEQRQKLRSEESSLQSGRSMELVVDGFAQAPAVFHSGRCAAEA